MSRNMKDTAFKTTLVYERSILLMTYDTVSEPPAAAGAPLSETLEHLLVKAAHNELRDRARAARRHPVASREAASARNALDLGCGLGSVLLMCAWKIRSANRSMNPT